MNYIYLYNKRVFKIVEYTQLYQPVTEEIKLVSWRLHFNRVPNEVQHEPLKYRFLVDTGFVADPVPITNEETDAINLARAIVETWEQYNNVATTHKIAATGNEYAHSLYQHLLFAEYTEYKKRNIWGPILQAHFDQTPELDLAAFVEGIRLKIQDLSYVWANLIHMKTYVKRLIDEGKILDARNYLSEEARKLNT